MPRPPPACREDTLRAYFCQFGPLEQAEIMKDRYTGARRRVQLCDVAQGCNSLSKPPGVLCMQLSEGHHCKVCHQ